MHPMAMACRCSAAATSAVARRACRAGLATSPVQHQPSGRIALSAGITWTSRPAVRPGRPLRHITAAAAAEADAKTADAAAANGADGAAAPVGPRFNAYLDFKFIRDNVEMLQQNAGNRKSSADVAAVAELYDKYIDMKLKTDDVRAARNANGKAMKQKLEKEQRDEIISAGKQLKEELEVLEAELNDLESQLQLEGQKIPNLTHPDVPLGNDEDLATLINEVQSTPNDDDVLRVLVYMSPLNQC